MLPKRDITTEVCDSAMEALSIYDSVKGEVLCKASCLLYAHETDKMNKLNDAIRAILVTASDRAWFHKHYGLVSDKKKEGEG